MATVKAMHNEAYQDYYLVENKNGVKLALSPFGARALDLIVPVGEKEVDLMVGPKDLAGYHENPYFNATIGPIAGRVAGAQFELDGETFITEDSQQGNTLHGGLNGYDKQTFDATPFQEEGKAGVMFAYTDPDGAHGFPGTVQVKATYTLSDENVYSFKFETTSDKPTIFNPTNHGYYNLTGSPANTIDEHTLEIRASKVGETNDDITTTGRLLDVAGTKFDFLGGKKIGTTLLDDPFVFDNNQASVLVLTSPDGLISMELTTTEPAVVIYTTRDAEAGLNFKNGVMSQHAAIAIEPQGIPGTEKYPQFGSIRLDPEKPFMAESSFKLHF